MNEQQLQQILTIQQAIAAAATAAVINSLLNPQQAAAGLANANALIDPASNDLQQQQVDSRQQSPAATSSPANQIDNTRIQDLLLQLQQQAAGAGSSPASAAAAVLNLNLNNQLPAQQNLAASPISRSPVGAGRLIGQQQAGFNAAAAAAAAMAATTSSNIKQSNQITPNKKLKRHHQPSAQQFPQQNRSSLEATSKPQHPTPKSHSTISSLTGRNNSGSNTNSSSSSTFLTNNVGLPRKLVRGQDVWLGRGAEQTRQILKCMWCGQSFRNLAEMTQHMKITQHYTNIISQEQITSWRQPENSETNSNKNVKQAAQVRNLEDNHDDLSEKLNESDREDSFSNDDETTQQHHVKSRSRSSDYRATNKRESTPANDSSSTTGSNQDEALSNQPPPSKGSSQQQSSITTKPLTRSRKREHEDKPQASKSISKEANGRENSPASVSSSSQRQNNSGLVLGDLNENSEANKEGKQSQGSEGSPAEQPEKLDESDERDDDNDGAKDSVECEGESKPGENCIKTNGDLTTDTVSDKELKEDELDNLSEDGDEIERSNKDEEDVDEDEEDENGSDNKDDASDKITRKHSKTKESNAIKTTTTTTTSGTKPNATGQKGDDTGDPLSALETMVEKSFDPRLRPGVANGGILQRLGIDEEVCPPWQHINYANWYAAAAYGHPMAAALLAAGINLQNGIKLSKNVAPKKSDD